MNGKQQVLTAMAGGKPERIPVFVSAYWDYHVRAAAGDPVDWTYGGLAGRLDIEVRAARRHEGAWLHRTATPTTHVPEPAERPVNLPPAGPPPWVDYMEKHLPHMVAFGGQAAAEVTLEHAEIPRRAAAAAGTASGSLDTTYLRAVAEALGDEALLAASGFALFPHTRSALGGIISAMYALAEDPAKVETAMDAVLECYARTIPACASTGAHAVWNGAYNEGADMVNPALWRRLIYPRHEQFVRMCHAAGLKAICWFLGDCRLWWKTLPGQATTCWPWSSRASATAPM